MDRERFECYEQFVDQVKYPMVMFEAVSGKVLKINNEAAVMFGKQVERLVIEPRNARVHQEFWQRLHTKKSLFWHRIRLIADETEFAVSGFVNEIIHEGVAVYTVIFETQMQFGGLVLENVLSQAKMVSVYLSVQGDERKTEYVSQNVNMFGFTSTQFYSGDMTIPRMICREDRKHVEHAFYNGKERHADSIVMECRVLTEIRELVPVRISVRYIYNESDNLCALEVLIFDLRDEIYYKRETDYLNQAISKMKSVLYVQNFYHNERELMYISPNATMLGMNVDALQNGLKLPEDYIHPADRDAVFSNIYHAIENGVAELEQTYRMVRDDGKQIWVLNEISLERRSDFGAQVSFLLTDVTEQKMIEQKLAFVEEEIAQAGTPEEQVGISAIDTSSRSTVEFLQNMTRVLNAKAPFYNAVFDLYANRVGEPAGPQERMGMLYDMFERPDFRGLFDDVTTRVVEQMIPIQTTYMLEEQLVQIIFTPILMRDAVRAFWVLVDFEQREISQLAMIASDQAKLANAVGKSMFIDDAIKREENLRKLSNVRLEKAQERNHLISDLLEDLIAKDSANCGKICQKVAVNLNVSYVGIYLQNKETMDVEKYFTWSQNGGEELFFDSVMVDQKMYQSLMNVLSLKKAYVIEETSGIVSYKQFLESLEVDSLMLCPIWLGDDIKGYVVFADEMSGHRFDKGSEQVAKVVAIILSELIYGRGQDSQLRMALEKSFSVYNFMAEAMYVKDNKSGKIVFANVAMNHLFGRELVGVDANQILVNRMQQYQMMDSVRNRIITNKKLVKWQTYLKELNRVMNITEIQLLEDDSGYNVVIMKETNPS